MASKANEQNVPVQGVLSMEQRIGDSKEDERLLREMAQRATEYISSFPWCKSIIKVYFGDGIGKIIAVFLFHIIPAQKGIDEWLWVVVGDIPPAYFVIDDSSSPVAAVTTYTALMSEWVELARRGETSDDVIAVNVPATPEWAEKLAGRLRWIKEKIIPLFSQQRNFPQ